MSNDVDFDEAAKDILDHITAIRDPELVITIDRWITKLTTEQRGLNDLNYLKLLQYMMINRRIGPPFVRPPPTGPLLPLSRILNPPLCKKNTSRYKDISSWRHTTKYSKAAQTSDFVEEEEMMESEFFDGESELEENPSYVGEEDNDVIITATPVGVTSSSTDVNVTGETTEVKNVENADGVNKRDGHLASGGERKANQAAIGELKRCMNKNHLPKFCNPCLDGMGRHLRMKPEPIDKAYMELLGDCAIPTLSEAEAKTVSPELLRVLSNVNDTTSLQDFYFQVSLYTCDQAELLMRVSDGMMDDFRAFVMDVFESRAEHISDGLAKEQTLLCIKYEYLRNRAFNRATVALDFLREAVPAFNWHKYIADPDIHLKWAILRRPPGLSASGDGNEDGATSSGIGCPSREQKTVAVGDKAAESASGRVGDGDEDDDADINAQQSTIKKLLYSLNWLRTEVMRADCEFHRLFDQQKEVTACLAKANHMLLANRCRTNGEINRTKDEHTLLRKKSVEQTETIDRLMEAIQISMQNKNKMSAEKSVNC